MLLKVLLLYFLLNTVLYTEAQLCDQENIVNSTLATFSDNDDVFFNGVKSDSKDFYTESIDDKRICLCKKGSCVRKCCPLEYAYNYKSKSCVPTRKPFNPPVWDDNELMENTNISQMFQFIYGKVNCSKPEIRIKVTLASTGFKLRKDGNLYIDMANRYPPWLIRGPDKYCIDTFITEIDGHITSELNALNCFSDESDSEDHNYELNAICMLISCVFIIATVAVYAWLPELRNLHGRVLIAYLTCLFVGFAFLSSMQLLLIYNRIFPDLCVGMSFVIYFFLLAAFFWLNVMCFDIWWTFSGKRGLSLEKLSIRARFYAYACYAFSIPTALTILLAILEFADLPPDPLLPNLKEQGCFLYDKSKLLYFYGPIVILCLANMTFFVLTAVKIAQIKKQTSVLKSNESSTHDQHRNDKQRLILYIKLFAVMGISWILEVISALYPQAKVFWKFTDIYNVLIGLTIFIIFVCKRKIFKLIKKRYLVLRGKPMSRTQTTTSRTFSSRDDFRMSSVKTTT